jgi:hypothetical protein
VLAKALEWSAALQVDEDKQVLWNNVLNNLAPYPTATSEDGKTVFAQANFTDGIPSAHSNGCARYPIVYFSAMHPAEVLDLTSDPHLVQIARDTVELVNKYNHWAPTNGMCLVGWGNM